MFSPLEERVRESAAVDEILVATSNLLNLNADLIAAMCKVVPGLLHMTPEIEGIYNNIVLTSEKLLLSLKVESDNLVK